LAWLFDDSSNQSIITKEFTARKKLRKVGVTVPVIGFGSPVAEMGKMYEVALKASKTSPSGGWQWRLFPTTPCQVPGQISWRFMQSRDAKA
jgi:hypothetical protein